MNLNHLFGRFPWSSWDDTNPEGVLYEPTEQFNKLIVCFCIFVCNLWSFPIGLSVALPKHWRFGPFPTTQVPSFQMERTSSVGKIPILHKSLVAVRSKSVPRWRGPVDELGAVCSLLSLPTTCSLLCCCFSCTLESLKRDNFFLYANV